MSCTYCQNGLRCDTCGAEHAGALGGSTLFFALPENAGLPGRGVLVEWGVGRVSAGLDGGPFVDLPLEGDPTAEIAALKARIAELDGVRQEQAAKIRRHLDELAAASDCYRAAREALEAVYCDAAAVMDPGALPDSETLGPEAGEQAAVLMRAIAALAHDRATLRDVVAKAEAKADEILRAMPTRRAARDTATTIEAPPPDDLLDRITPDGGCRHTRRNLRPDPHGNPVTTCIDCGDEIP